MISRRAMIERAITQLAEAGIADPGRDARVLLRWSSGLDGASLTSRLSDSPDPAEASRFTTAIAQRSRRMPVSHITGRRAFSGLEFTVTSDVLDPRPETESLIEVALERPSKHVLDLGTGSGCILITLLKEWEKSTGVGVDRSDLALAVARRNATDLGVGPRSSWLVGSWYEPVSGPFDLIVANPPYLSDEEFEVAQPELQYEPRDALTPGGDGLDAYRVIAAQATEHLTTNGRLILEIGMTQAHQVSVLLADAGLVAINVHPDLDGRDRIISARFDGKS
ncbi:MAG: peptide chain release factor N(5)-glutamine methyltransferase [Pseudomonadota bacterium]